MLGATAIVGVSPEVGVVPVAIDPSIAWNQLSAGVAHVCGVTTGGFLYCWGNDDAGELGTGESGITANWPMQEATQSSDWLVVYPGDDSTCALKTSGHVYCFGDIDLCDGPASSTPQRYAPDDDTTYQELAMGWNHACGLTSAGVLRCWGDNSDGQLGVPPNTTPSSDCPVTLSGTWSDVSAAEDRTCAVDVETNWTMCWGAPNGYLAENISGSVQTMTVAASGAHTCALSLVGELFCQGHGGEGRLGLGDESPASFLTSLGQGTDWRAVAVGGAHSCAIDPQGDVYCWGDNSRGQLGTGDMTNRLSPARTCIE